MESSSNHIRVRSDMAGSETGAHEMIHTMGAGHSSGLMSPQKGSSRTEKLSIESVIEMNNSSQNQIQNR